MIQNFLNFCTNIFFNKYIWNVCIYLQKNIKGWSHKKIIFYFFCIFDLLSKKLENNFFMRAPLLCANISQIFFSQLDHQKYLLLFIQESVQLVPSLFHILQQACWKSNRFLWKFYYCWDGFQLVPKYQTKVKLISNNSVWNIWIAKKWKPRCAFLTFRFPTAPRV